jgi:stage IV sporulation protein FB
VWRLRIGRFYLRFHPGTVLAAALFFLFGRDLWLRYLALLGVLAIHETAHATTALALHGRRAVVTIWPWGGVAHVPRASGFRQALVALAGPVANLVAAGIFALAGARPALALGTCALPDLLLTANLVMGIGNLLPLPPLDGGRAWQSFREEKTR